MLYDKILEYIKSKGIKQSIDSDSNFIPVFQEDMAYCIAEIAKEYHLVYMADSIKAFKENAEYQKGMIADAKIIKEADNRIIELEKENAELEAKLKEEIMTISKCVGEWKEKISILEVKAVARNGRILDLEQQLLNKDKI